jgi:NitT/TauT family transport system substrate-binding protein
VSLSSGVGKLVEYPYGTAMGSLNMVFGAHRDTLAERPELTKVVLGIHRKASEFGMKNPSDVVAMAVAKLGQKKEAIDASVSNVELTWRFGPTEIRQAKTYAEHMLELRQIKELPDFVTFFDTRFVDDLAKQA